MINIDELSSKVNHARELFFERGSIPDGLISDVIKRSWLRCRASGLQVNSPQNFDPPLKSDINDIKERNSNLVTRAEPVMELLFEQLRNSQRLVLLTDEAGVILRTLGDEAFLTRAQKYAIYPGVSWEEGNKGTNAAGTALFEKTPVCINGPQHYLSANSVLTCSAAPIFGPFGEIAGLLDITGDFHTYQPDTLAMAHMSALMIENHLFQDHFAGSLMLHFHSRPEFIGTLNEGIAVFGSEGQFISINRNGLTQMGLDRNELQQHDLYTLFSSAFGALKNHSNNNATLLRLRLFNGVVIYARVQSDAHHLIPIADGASTTQPALTPPRKIAEPKEVGLDYLDSGDKRVRTMIAKIRRFVGRDIKVLIQGETGSGKEMLARAIHGESARRQGPFVAVNCAAIPEGLIESELFGYKEGAFTGARRKGCAGKVLQANGGTLFLDEIGDMSLHLQARLLRVLHDRNIVPLGSNKPIPVDFSVICATHRKLRDLIAKGDFREDLYYRLNGITVTLPPLRDRTDFEILIERMVNEERGGNPPVTIAPEVMTLFQRYPWPGNLRQLNNVVRSSIALLGREREITRAILPDDFLEEIALLDSPLSLPTNDEDRKSVAAPVSLDDIEMSAIKQTIEANNGNISAAARQLGISRNTLYRKMKRM